MMQPMSAIADAELVELAKGGDRSAFDQLLGPLIDQAYRLACAMLHDHQAAEDAVQEAAVRSWRKLNNLRPGTQMRPWFLAIVANQCRTTTRGKWWSVLRLEGQLISRQASFEDLVARGADVRAAMLRMTPEHREVLLLHFFLDLPLAEVAAITGLPLGTVKSRLNRGIVAMRPLILAMQTLTLLAAMEAFT
jgi:RNA polymerase sigma-70 factor (ECF subfamily)